MSKVDEYRKHTQACLTNLKAALASLDAIDAVIYDNKPGPVYLSRKEQQACATDIEDWIIMIEKVLGGDENDPTSPWNPAGTSMPPKKPVGFGGPR